MKWKAKVCPPFRDATHVCRTQQNLFYFEHPHPLLYSGVGHSRKTLGLGTPGVGHSWETLGLGTPARLCGWALWRHSGVGHSRETLGLGIRDSGVGHSKNTLELGTPGTLWVGHSRDERGVDWARRRVPGEEKCSGRGEELSLKSNNPTPRVGNKSRHGP